MEENELCGLFGDDPVRGTYTTEGITKLCEGLKGSAVTSLECAAAPERLLLCQRPLTEKQTRLCAHRLGRNDLRPKGGAALAEGIKGNSTLTSLSSAARYSNLDHSFRICVNAP